MPVFQKDVKIAGTMYVRADNAEEAERKARQWGGLDVNGEVFIDAGESEDFSGRRFDDLDLPEVSLSPAMTVMGLYEGAWERADEEDDQ